MFGQESSGLTVPEATKGGLLPVVAAARCNQHAAAWINVARALEGDDLESTRNAVEHLRAAIRAVGPIVQAVEAELQRRQEFAAGQQRAREQIEVAMATVRHDVGALGDALVRGKEAELNTEELFTLVSAIVDEERKETARRALVAAVNPCESGVPSGAALRAALDLAQSCDLPQEEQAPALQKLQEDHQRALARQALADALIPAPEHRSVEAIGEALERAREAGVAEEELQAAEEALREGQKNSIWYDIISIIAEDGGDGQGALAGLVGLGKPTPRAA